MRVNRSIGSPRNCLTYWSRLFQIFANFPVREDREFVTALFERVSKNTFSHRKPCSSTLPLSEKIQSNRNIFREDESDFHEVQFAAVRRRVALGDSDQQPKDIEVVVLLFYLIM
jgi:hypothetical protein